tara:strand:+ start:677 stop:1441 length:765 start_codon:yes stop_codon:yes gene_type:complete
MSYKPFKMLGHEHPGIKQKAPLEMSMEKTHINENMVDGVDKNPGSGINYKATVGSSPAKNWLSNITNSAKKLLGGKSRGGGAAAPVAVDQAQVVEGGDAPAVPPHGDESHSGGAIGGGELSEAQPPAFEAMDSKEFRGMNSGDRMSYMKGLSKEDRRSQMKSNMSSMSPFGGGGASAIGNMFSDIRLKEKIKKTGKSPSGIPTYEFNYIGDNNRYSGVMAQDLIEMNIDAVSTDDSGFYKVNYNNIDVDMHLIN